jgi:DNA-directed RNA polymerase subunit RPC12/RpoP
MPTDYDNDLLREGILHYRVKEFDTARKYLERAVDTADDLQTRAQANYYLSLLTDDPVQKRNYLEETLAIDMTHAEARRSLAILDGKLKASDIINPDAPAAPSAEMLTVQADRFTCPKCGGRMVYAPDGLSLVCEYCGHSQRLSGAVNRAEQDFFIAMANGSSQHAPATVQIFQCQGCGATFVLPSDEISATCAYCGSTHVVSLKEKRRMILPDSILPMAFDQKQAARRLVHWVEEMHLKLQSPVQTPRGLYLPVWTFDILGNVPWHGTVYRDQREVPVSGEENVHFEELRVLGSSRVADLMTKALPEFNLRRLPAYDPRFLAGWMADVYDLPMAEASLEARRAAVEQVRGMIHAAVGQVHNLSYSTASLMVSAFKLVLVPAWIAEITAQDQTARVLINGQTGSVHSTLPKPGLAGWLENNLTNR